MFGVLVVSMSLMCAHIASLVLLLIYVTEAILHYNYWTEHGTSGMWNWIYTKCRQNWLWM